MQKIERGVLESRIDTTRQRLLTAIDGVPETTLRIENAVSGRYSVADILAYFGLWGETANKGMREIQRRKKPTDLLRAIDNQATFQQKAIADSAELDLDDILFRLEDAQIQIEQRLAQYSADDLNRPKRIRFLGNKPLWPLLAQITYETEMRLIPEIEAFLKRHA